MIKPQPEQVIPLGLAIITSAFVPTTSVFPSKRLVLLPVIWFKIRLAWFPAVILELPEIFPPVSCEALVPALLLRIMPELETLNSTILNFQVGGDFSYNDANNDFVLNESDNLVVLGSASITADNYTQSGVIDIAGDLSIQVTNEARLDDNASIKAKNLLFSAYDFYNQADLLSPTTSSFDIGNDFNNGFYLDGYGYQDGGDIIADNFNVTAGYRFSNSSSATINADNFNVNAEGFRNGDYRYYGDSATINANNFNVTADGFSNRATISADSFNIVSSSFNMSDYANIYARDLTISTDRFANSAELGGIYANNFNLTTNQFSNWGINVVNNFIIKISGSAQNYGTIIADYLSIVAEDTFRNSHEEGIIEAINFNATVDSFSNDRDSRIRTTNFYVVANDFKNDDSSITAEENFYATITKKFLNEDEAYIGAGDFNVITSSFINDDDSDIRTTNFNLLSVYFLNWHYSDIDTKNFNATVSNEFTNSVESDIRTTNFNVIVGDEFDNTYSTINADNFNVTAAANFENGNSATISTNIFNVTAGDRFYNSDRIYAEEFNVTVNNSFDNRGRIQALNVGSEFSVVQNFTVSADEFTNEGGYIRHFDNFNATVNNFRNIRDDADIIVNNFNVTVDEIFLNSREARIYSTNFNVITKAFENQNSSSFKNFFVIVAVI